MDLSFGRLLLAPALAALLVVPVLELSVSRARHDDDRVVRRLVHDRPELLVRRVEHDLQLDVRRRVGVLAVRLDPRVLVVLVELAERRADCTQLIRRTRRTGEKKETH